MKNLSERSAAFKTEKKLYKNIFSSKFPKRIYCGFQNVSLETFDIIRTPNLKTSF